MEWIHEESCPICYEKFDEEAAGRTKLEPCGHEFCRGCLHEYCANTIQERRVPIACPFSSSSSQSCSTILTEEQVHQLTTSPLWTKYQRAIKLRNEPSLVACSRCEELVSTSHTKDTTVHCSCGHSFCKVHGDLHPADQTCQEFLSKQGRAAKRHARLSERAVRKLAKPCSHCSSPIELYAGCDHIVCTACHNDFCWRCGTHVHLTGTGTIRHCHSCDQRYIDHRKLNRLRMKTCLLLPILLPLALLYIVAATVIAVFSCGCALCFCCGTLLDEEGRLAPHKGIIMTMFGIFAPLLEILLGCGIDLSPAWLKRMFDDDREEKEQQSSTDTMNHEIRFSVEDSDGSDVSGSA